MCLCFGSDKLVLEEYTNANMTCDIDSKMSTSRFLMTFARGAISWQSKLYNYVALSTTEVEYIAIIKAYKEAL